MAESGNNYTFSILVRADTAEMRDALKLADGDLKNFGKTVKDVSDYVNSWTTKAQRAVLACAGFQTLAKTMTGTLQRLLTSFTAFGERLSATASQTNVFAESLSKLKYAAEQCGSSFETALDAVKTFQEQLGAASLGDSGAQDKLKAAGVDWGAYLGLTEEDQFLKLAAHIASISIPAEQARVAMELLGDAGYQLLPFFQQGEAGIRGLCAEAEKLGYAFRGKNIEQARTLSQQLTRLTASASALGRSFMSALAPSLESVLCLGESALGGTVEFIQRHPELMKVVGVATLTFAGLGTALVACAAAATLLATTKPLGWVGLGVGAAASLGVALQVCADQQQSLNDEMKASARLFREQTEPGAKKVRV